jgi:predicted nucleic acid-binding protein
LEAQDGVISSVISVEELDFGIARAPAKRRRKLARWLDALLDSATILEVTLPIARAAGELRAARESTGVRMAQADAFIGATALVHGLTLATRNIHDFKGCGVALFDPFAG